MLMDKPSNRLNNFVSLQSHSQQISQKRKLTENSKLPTIPNLSNQNLSIITNGLLSSRPPLERSPSIPNKQSINIPECGATKGPKVYNKNLPEVFLANTPRQKLSQKNMLESKRARPQSSKQNSFDGKFFGSINHSDQSREQDYLSPSSQQFNNYRGHEKSDSFSVRLNNALSSDHGRPVYTEESKKDNFQMNLKLEYYSEAYKQTPHARSAHLHKASLSNQLCNYYAENGVMKHQSNKSINVPAQSLEGDIKNNIAFNKMINKIPKSSRFSTKYEDLSASAKKHTKNLNHLPTTSLQLHELVTLKKIRETNNKGILKRMLHVPTFRMLDIQQEPISELGSKENKQLKEWVDLWKTSFSKSQFLGHIYWTFWNSPEGCVSITTESARNGYLSNLIENNGNLPERSIQEIAKSLVGGIHEIYTKINRPHGNIKLEEIMITRKGTAKLLSGTLTGFSNILNPQQVNTNSEHENNNKNIFHDNSKKVHLEQSSSLSNDKKFSGDIFDLGLILLQCAIGDLSLLDADCPLSIENIKSAISTFDFQKTGSRSCCLLHSESLVRKVIVLMNSTTPNEEKKSTFAKSPRKLSKSQEEKGTKAESYYLSILDILRLNNGFSQEFENFLCSCLQLDPNQLPDIVKLMTHKFLQNEHKTNGPLCNLSEMVKIEKTSQAAKEQTEKQLEKLNELLKVGFLDKIVKEKFNLMLERSPKNDVDEGRIFELAKELDVPVNRLKKIVNKFY